MAGTILVTGANGLLGSQCVAALAENQNREVIAIWHKGRECLLSKLPANVRYVQCDLADLEAVRKLFGGQRIDAVVHAAAALPDATPDYFRKALSVNVQGTANVVSAASEAGCPRFVYCSSVSVYGTTDDDGARFSETDLPSPEDVYAWSKWAGEEYVRLCCHKGDMTGVALRLSGLHGPGRKNGVFFNIVLAASKGESIVIRNNGVPFQFLALSDAVAAILRCIPRDSEVAENYLVINVASMTVPSISTIADAAVKMAADRNSSIIVVPQVVSAICQVMSTDKMSSLLGTGKCGLHEMLHSIFCYVDSLKVSSSCKK